MDDKFLKLSIETDTFMDRKYPLWRDTPLYENVWQQKFAELIIQECARKLENDGMVEVAMELKWHFGIKS